MSRWTTLAEWRGPSPHHGGAMLEQRGLVVHIAEGTYEGTIAWAMDPDQHWSDGTPVQVSCHFVAGIDGRLAQLVDTDVEAYTQRAGNGHWLSVECAGFTPHAISDEQVTAVARLLAEAHMVYGVPVQVTDTPSGFGLGHHSMGGPSWGHQDCPGPAIIAQKPLIVQRALQLAYGGKAAWPGRFLRYRQGYPMMSGQDVRTWQARMRDRGWQIDVDGWYGPKSAQVCREFQRAYGLLVDGIVGPITWQAAWSQPVPL